MQEGLDVMQCELCDGIVVGHSDLYSLQHTGRWSCMCDPCPICEQQWHGYEADLITVRWNEEAEGHQSHMLYQEGCPHCQGGECGCGLAHKEEEEN